MTIYFDERRQRWTYDFECNRQRFSGYCVDKDGVPVTSERAAKEAQEIARRASRLGPKLPQPDEVTIAQIAADLMPMWRRQGRWENIRKYHLPAMLDFFGPAKPVREIDDDLVSKYREHLFSEPVKIWAGGPKRNPKAPENARYWRERAQPRSAMTINLRLEILRAVLQRAAKLRNSRGEFVFANLPHVAKEPKPKRKARPVPDRVIDDIFETAPAHVVDAIELTLLFGFRKGEAFGLQLSHIDWEGRGIRFTLDEVKDREDAFLPAGTDAMVALERLAAQAKARGVKHLIAYRRPRDDISMDSPLPWRPIKNPRKSWERIMNQVEAKFGRRWRWHDLRAAFITHVALKSGPIAAQALARHSEYKTTEGYVEAADEFRRKAAEEASGRPALANLRKRRAG